MTRTFTRRLVLTCGILGAVGLWLAGASHAPQPLPPPDAPRTSVQAVAPPPPPPPPPPSAGPGQADSGDIRFVYGEATYSSARGDAAPVRVTDVPAVYPPLAVWNGVSGRVGIEATVDERGRVADARVIQPAHWMLNQSALNAVRQWTFEPRRTNGVATVATIVATVDFTPPR